MEVIVTESPGKREVLTGRRNYLGWSKIVANDLIDKGYITGNGWPSEFHLKAKALIFKYLTIDIASIVDDSLGPEEMWEWLKNEYGENDPYILKRELRAVEHDRHRLG